MPKGKYQRKQKSMQSEMLGAVHVTAPESAPEPSADSAPVFEDTVLALLQQMTASIKELSARVDAVEAAPVPFVPQSVESLSGSGERSRKALDADPDGIPHSQKIAQFPNGERVPQMVMNQYRPRFGSGDLVRFNLDEVPHGRKDGKTRRELKAADGTPDGVGEVIDRTYLSDRTGQWKYTVVFDKRVLPGSNGGRTAVYERELMPA